MVAILQSATAVAPATKSSFPTEPLLNMSSMTKMEKDFVRRMGSLLKDIGGTVTGESKSPGFPGGGDRVGYTYMQHIVYVKVPKAASSTTAGVARRIGKNHGLHGASSRKWLEMAPYKHLPGVWANHERLSLLKKGIKKLKLPCFTFTVIREPVRRCLSMFYHFTVTRGGGEPSAENKIAALDDCTNYLFSYTAPVTKSENAEDLTASAVMKAYNFIGIAEMYEESMVVLAYLMDVPLGDILYIKAKVAGGAGGRGGGKHSGLSTEPKEVQDYAAGDKFQSANKLDYELYQAAVDRINRYYEEVPGLKETRVSSSSCSRFIESISSREHKSQLLARTRRHAATFARSRFY